jgi:hypothetical protein
MNRQKPICTGLGFSILKKAFGGVINQKSLIELQKNKILVLRMENGI